VKGSEVTVRASEQQVEASGYRSEILEKYDRPIPQHLAYLMGWFWQLSGRRTCGMGGLDPISWEAVDAWASRTKNNPRQWELDALCRIDNAYLVANAPEKPKAKETK